MTLSSVVQLTYAERSGQASILRLLHPSHFQIKRSIMLSLPEKLNVVNKTADEMSHNKCPKTQTEMAELMNDIGNVHHRRATGSNDPLLTH
jgi:hypothetical protein